MSSLDDQPGGQPYLPGLEEDTGVARNHNGIDGSLVPKAMQQDSEQAREGAPDTAPAPKPILPRVDKNSLWYRYKHLLPVPITLISALILTPIMLPYFKNPLITNLSKEHFRPHYIGIPGFDTFLGFVVPFFRTMANSETCGIIPLGYFVTIHLGWQMVGAIESSRRDAGKSIFVRYYSLVVTVALVIGSYVITPLFWIIPYLSFNKVSCRDLTLRDVSFKKILHLRAYAVCAVILIGFNPFLAGMMLSHNDSKFVLNTALFFTTPLLWQLIWMPFGTLIKGSDDAIKGHKAAMYALLLTAGAALAWHAYAVIAIYRDPSIVTQLMTLFTNYKGDRHTILFIAVDAIILWAGFLTIPLAQEGLQAAAVFILMTVLTGPGAALALYFFWRESKFLEVREFPSLSPLWRKLLLSIRERSFIQRATFSYGSPPKEVELEAISLLEKINTASRFESPREIEHAAIASFKKMV